MKDVKKPESPSARRPTTLLKRTTKLPRKGTSFKKPLVISPKKERSSSPASEDNDNSIDIPDNGKFSICVLCFSIILQDFKVIQKAENFVMTLEAQTDLIIKEWHHNGHNKTQWQKEISGGTTTQQL